MTVGTGGTSNSMRPHVDQITAAIPRELGTRQDDKKSSAGMLVDGNGARIVADAIKPLILEIAILKREINELRGKVK
jgi:hypothetical protein